MAFQVTLNGHLYDWDTHFTNWAHAALNPNTGVPNFISIFQDFIAASNTYFGAITSLTGIAPSTAGNVLISDGTNWRRTRDVTTPAFFGGALTMSGANTDGLYFGATGPRLRFQTASSRIEAVNNGASAFYDLAIASLIASTGIFGSDPGGSSLLRVGGGALLTGLIDAPAARFTSNTFASAGAGTEIGYGVGRGYLQVYDRTGAVYKPIDITGDSIRFVPGGNTVNAPVIATSGAMTIPISLVIGTDPGTTALLRIGGGITVAGAISSAAGNNLLFATNGSSVVWFMNTSGHLLSNNNNNYDIGGPSNLVRDLYVGRNTYTTGTAIIGSATKVTSGTLEVVKNSTIGTEATAGIYIHSNGNAHPGLILGADDTAGKSYIQAIQVGTSWSTVPLLLNPNGGVLVFGTDPGGSDLFRVGGNIRATGFTSGRGSTSMATATFTTIFTPTLTGRFEVGWCLSGSGTTYMGIATVIFDGVTTFIQSSTVGANTAIQVSGTSVQVRQSSGATTNVLWGFAYHPAG